MSIFLNQPQIPRTVLEGEYPSTPEQFLQANRQQTIEMLPEALAIGAASKAGADVFGKKITEQEAISKWDNAGLPVPPAERLMDSTSEAQDILIENAKNARRREAIMFRANAGTMLSTRALAESFALQFVSPTNIGSGFLNFARLPATAAGLAKGRSLSQATAAAARMDAAKMAGAGYGKLAGRGALEGFAGNLLVEAGTYPAANYLNYDYTMADSLVSIGLGAPFGAVLHVAPRALRDTLGMFNRKKTADIAPSLEGFRDIDTDVLDVPTVAASQAVETGGLRGEAEQAWQDAADELRSLGLQVKDEPPASATQAAAELRAAAESLDAPEARERIMEQARAMDERAIDEYVRDDMDALLDRTRALQRGELKRPEDNLPKFPFLNEIKRRGGVQSGSVLAQELEAMGVYAGAKGVPVGLFKKKGGLSDIDNIPLSEWKLSEAVDDGAGYVSREHILSGVRSEIAGNPVRPTIKRAPMDEEVMLDNLDRMGIDIASMSNREIKDMIKQAEAVEANSAADKIYAASGQTRKAAMDVAVAQFVDGRPINVEPILKSDPRYGENPPTAEELSDMARPYMDDEAEAIDDMVDARKEEDSVATTDAAFDQSSEMAEIPFGVSTAAEVLADVRTAFGKATERLLDASKLRVVQSIDRLPRGIDYPPDTKGVKLPDGTVYLVADNIDKGQVKGLVLHEAGVHLGMRAVYGDEGFAKILDDVMASADPSVTAARAAVPKDTPAHQVAEETLAYLVENSPEHSIVRRIIAAIKVWARDKFGLKFDIDEASARHMALGALKRVSKMGEGKSAEAFFSRGGDVEALPSGLTPKITRAENQFSISLVDDTGKEHYFMGVFKDPDGTRPHAVIDYVENKTREYKDAGAALYILAAKEAERHLGVRLRTGGNELAQKVGEKLKAAGRLDKDRLIISSPTERTAAGDQMVLEGAERISDKQLAERKMEQALKAKKPQKEMDIGLFGDDAKQTVLFSRKQKPEKPQASLDIAAEKRVFDRALKEAEGYAPILRNVVNMVDNPEALREAFESAGVTQSVISHIIKELKNQHTKVGNELRRQRKLLRAEEGVTEGKSFEELVAERTGKEIQDQILAAKREAAYNYVARERAKAHIRQFGSFATEGFLSTLTGSSMLRSGARNSVAVYQKAYLDQWARGLEHALKKEGLRELFVGRALERDVASALEELDFAKPDFSGINADAVKIAKVMHKYQEATRNTLNTLGASIKYREGYITRQSHDQLKIRSAGFDAWAKDALQWFDFERMGNPKDRMKALREIWDELASGTYQIEMPSEMKDHDFRSGINLAKKVSHSRQIVFKKRAWFDYNAKYGTRDVAAAYIRGLENSARIAGLMRMWGTNPKYNIERAIDDVTQELREGGDADGAAKLAEKKDKIINNLAIVDGTANLAGNIMGAQISSNIRLLTMMSKLGSSIFASMTDVPLYAANLRYEGRGNLMTGAADAIKGLASNMNEGARKEVLDALDVTFDNFVGEVMHQFTKGAGFSANISAGARVYTKWNLQQWWTHKLQKSLAYGFANYMGKNANLGFEQLSDDFARILKIHNIDKNKWDVLRLAVRDVEGKPYMLTDAIESLPDNVIASYIESKGRQVTPKAIENARAALANDYRAMIIDRAESGVLSGDKRTEAAMIGGTKRGTVWGETVRFIGQFKSFPAMMYERVLKREVYGRGYDTVGQYMKNGKGDMLGLVNLMVAMTMTGYLALTIKDALKGKSPRPLDRPRTWTEAMVQGGFFGLAGDHMLGEYDNYSGRSFVASLAGPFFGGTINDLMGLKTAIENGDKSAVRALKLIQNNLPGANLFYVKPVMDYMFMYSLQESMNPGYLRRMEANSIRDTGQTWLMRPSEAAR